jgi:hypothetical protein
MVSGFKVKSVFITIITPVSKIHSGTGTKIALYKSVEMLNAVT